jgi:two-component system, sensor histidine kinase
VERSLARSQGGLGLGLPLVKSLVELHGGTVVARSAGPGRGSEFEVRLPLAAAPAAQAAPSAAAPSAAGPEAGDALRVLVVEDNADGRDSLVTLLRTWGHRVAVARDGPEGLARLRADRPDVALVDIGLPGFDGNELARRARGGGGDVPRLVAMTGYGQPEDRTVAMAAGFDHYLVKPVEPDDLRRVLQAARTARRRPLAADAAPGRPPSS